MLIWRGFGFWAALLPMLAIVVRLIFSGTIGYVSCLSMLIIGAVLIIYFGFKLNKNPVQRYKNLKTGEEFEVIEKHDFFFIPMQYWGMVMLAIVLCLKINSLLNS